MQAALALETEEPRLLFRHVGRKRARRVHVTDGDIPLFPERVIRQVVLRQVLENLAIGPIDDRVNLHDAVLLAREMSKKI